MKLARLIHAIDFATIAHKGDFRKGTDIPYITHPYAVGMLLMQHGCDEDVIIAGLLHDVEEDTDFGLDDIEMRFGKSVRDIVAGCSEQKRFPDNTEIPWEVRKQHTIDHLPAASMAIKLVACADKLHNITSMLKDYDNCGEKLWERFNKGHEDQKWYFQSLAKVFTEGETGTHSLTVAFTEAVTKLFP